MRGRSSNLLSGALFAFLLGLITLFVGGLAIGNVSASPVHQAGVATSSPNGLVINEVYDSQTPSYEFFELYNTSAITIDLRTYVIYNRDGSTPLANLDDTLIGPGEFRAIGPTQLHTPAIAGSGLARIDFLGLVNTSPTDTTIDVVNFGGPPNVSWPNYNRFRQYFFTGNPPALATEDGARSLQRYPDGVDTDQPSDWNNNIYSSPSSASCGDPYEDDNGAGQATTQSVNTSTLHRICPAADQDWVGLSLSSSFTYTLRATANGNLVDTVLRLYDSSNVLLAEDNNPGSRDSIINFRPTSAGTFRIQVLDAQNSGGVGAAYLYTFSVTASSLATSTPTTPTPTSCEDAYEPDNSLQTAKPIALNTEQQHTLCPVGDQDWVTFVASGGKVYTMYTKDLAGPVDTIISLYDAAGTKLAENDDYQPGQGLYSRIDYTFPGTAVYYLRIRDKRGSGGIGYTYTVGLQSTGALPPTATSTVTPTPNPNTATPTLGPCTDLYEPDGLPESAKLILIGSTQHHSICPVADADFVKFYARAGKVYTIRTSNLGIGLDTFMYLFDTDGQKILAQNDDGGDGVASRIDFYPQRDDFYYIQVKNAGDYGGPDQTYDLSLAVVPGAPLPPGTATPIIAPPVTVTIGSVEPTVVIQPTKPPALTPTQGVVPPTPAVPNASPSVPRPVATKPVEVVPPGQTAVPPLEASPTSVIVIVPGVPPTGHDPYAGNPASKPVVPVVVLLPHAAQASTLDLSTLAFTLFYDANRNNIADRLEGIRGVDVFFVDASNALNAFAKLTTGADGTGKVSLPRSPAKIYIPYFGIDLVLNDFPSKARQAWTLPAVVLPDHVP